MPENLKPIAKAVVSALVALAGYLVGVMGAEDTLADVTVVQWLGAVVFLGGAFGITYAVPNKPGAVGRRKQG